MHLQLRNIGQITNADIRFGDLTVFVGPLGPSRNSAAVTSIWRETQRRDRSGEQSQSRSSGENHQGCFPCLDPPSSRTSRLFLCLLPRERTECIDRSDRLDPAPRFDGWIVAPVFVWPRPLSFINA